MTAARVVRRWDAKRPWSEGGPFRATLRPGIVAEALRPPGGRGGLLVRVHGPGLAARAERRRPGLFGDERRSRGACLRPALRGVAKGAGRRALRSRAAAPRAAPSPVQALPRSLLRERRVIMVADRRKLEDRIDRIRRFKRDLEEFGLIPREAFRANRERQYAVLHAMQSAIEGCIEIASHIVSADRLGAPTDYAHLFSLLEENGVLPSAVAEAMRQMARFRNRIVHLYWDLDLDLVYGYLTGRLGDLDSYLAAIEGYLGR